MTNNIEFEFFNTLDCIKVEGAVVSGDNEVTVPKKGSKDITVTIDLSNAQLPENVFVEGFIYLEPVQETDEEGVETSYPQLVVPYVGFYGDWAGENAPRVLDSNRFDEDNTVWEVAGMIGDEGSYLGVDAEEGYEGWEDRVAISPNNEDAYHNIMPVLAFMRNAEEAEFNILDERGKVVKKLYTDHWISKTHARNPIYLAFETLWDGTVNSKVVEDGQYYYQIKVKPQYKDAKWQEWKVPVVVDTKVPEITEIKYDKDTKKLTWKAEDEGTGINYFTFYKVVKDENDELERVPIIEVDEDTGEEVEFIVSAAEENENGEYELDLSPYGAFVNFVVVAHDYAENTSEAIAYPDTTFKLESPEAFSLFDESKVIVSGTAVGYEKVKVTISYGEDLEVVAEDTIPVNQITGKFGKEIELGRDGIFRINVAVIDSEGKETKDMIPNRIFYVDTTAPEILETESSVVRSKYIDELSAEEVLNSPVLLGGGRTIIFVEDGVGYAYDRKLIKDDILERFNKADEKYVKLADGIFIDKNGYLTDKVPAVKYFEDKLVATIKVHVKENFGEFEVRANDQYVGDYGELSLLNPSEFDDWIEFELELLPDTKTVEIKVADIMGNKATKTIVLDIDNPVDEEVTIDEIKDIEAETTVFEEFELPTEVKAILSNGSTKMVPVEWTAPEGIEIVDNKVTINKEGTYEFVGNVDGYGEVKLILKVKLIEITRTNEVVRADSTGGESLEYAYEDGVLIISAPIEEIPSVKNPNGDEAKWVGVKIPKPTEDIEEEGTVKLIIKEDGKEDKVHEDISYGEDDPFLYYFGAVEGGRTQTLEIVWNGTHKETLIVKYIDIPIEATFKPTDNIGIAPGTAGEAAGKIYAEYELLDNEGERISLAEGNVEYIKVKDGEEWKELTPNTDETLWFNVESEQGESEYVVKTVDGKVYTATLDWEEEINEIEFTPTDKEGTRPGTEDTYVEFEILVDGERLSLAEDNIKLIAKKVEDKWVELEPNTDETLWFKKNKETGLYQFFIVTKEGTMYKATLDWKGLEDSGQ